MAKITISLPDAVMEELNSSAESYGLSRSAFVSMCIRDRIKQDQAVKFIPQMGRFFQLCDEHRDEIFRGSPSKEVSAELAAIKGEIGLVAE